jgi:hypothetical protein
MEASVAQSKERHKHGKKKKKHSKKSVKKEEDPKTKERTVELGFEIGTNFSTLSSDFFFYHKILAYIFCFLFVSDFSLRLPTFHSVRDSEGRTNARSHRAAEIVVQQFLEWTRSLLAREAMARTDSRS